MLKTLLRSALRSWISEKRTLRCHRTRLGLERLEAREVPTGGLDLTVNTLLDTHVNAANLGDGSARDTNGNVSLRSAIEEINNDGVGSTIQFAVGGATNHVGDGTGGVIWLTQNASLDITVNMGINGNGQVIERPFAAGTPLFGLFLVNMGTNVGMQALELVNGNAGNGNGGAINNKGTLTVAGLMIHANDAGGVGGAISNEGTLSVSDGRIWLNQAAAGGGIYNAGSLQVNRGGIDSNTATALGGGGIFNLGTCTITGTPFSDNWATTGDGGGIYNNAGTLIMNSGSLGDNRAANVGGGIYVFGGSTTTRLNSVGLVGNQAGNEGGGFYLDSGSLLLDWCTVAGNLAPVGDGGYVKNGATFNDMGTNTITDEIVFGP